MNDLSAHLPVHVLCVDLSGREMLHYFDLSDEGGTGPES